VNRIIREHYPVSNLPEDLRKGLAKDRPVSIVIVQDELSPLPSSPENATGDPIKGGDFTRLRHLRRESYSSSAEVDAYLDSLRNEWAHRER
jgi:hypothetical protein